MILTYTTPNWKINICFIHYRDIIMGAMASQIPNLTIVYWTVYSDADQRKHESSASLAFVWRIHRGPVKSPHKCPMTRKMFPFDDVIMIHIIKTFYCSIGQSSMMSIYRNYLKTYLTYTNTELHTMTLTKGLRQDPCAHWRISSRWPSVTLVNTLTR